MGIQEERRLLELAARAAGYDTSHPWNAERMRIRPQVVALCIDAVSTAWNPLEHDDHALRLAVMLEMNIYTSRRCVVAAELFLDDGWPLIVEEEFGDSETRFAATRLAIVKVAAELGGQEK